MAYMPDMKRDLEYIEKAAESKRRREKRERLDRFAIAALALTGEADMAHAKIASLEDRAEFAYGMALALEAEREKILQNLEEKK
ncbi:hypothetical protein M0R72_13805 [Candidatus Pacearchaeota archaeon]|jgi:hypothetical protein|nr:hypothetical protein [Candidatus Pacearchaeota archaeon]